ncbi:unnamed protein product, partial [Rodentolepis nana]
MILYEKLLRIPGYMNSTICSLIKEKALILINRLPYQREGLDPISVCSLTEKALILYEKLLRIEEKTLILYEKLLCIPMDKFFNKYENRSRHLKTQSGLMQKTIELKKSNTPQEQMRTLALETIDVIYPSDLWLQVYTDGSFIESQANVGAGDNSELFSFYAAAGHNRSAFEAIR